jgi:hypothetical protein
MGIAMNHRADRTTTMADKKITSTNPDAKATDEVEDQDQATEQQTAHPGYKYYRKTRQFGG